MSMTQEAARVGVSRPGANMRARLAGFIQRHVAGDEEGVRRGAASAFLVRVASAGLLYLSQIVLARWMGGFEYGVYIAVWTWVLVLGGLCNLGMPTLMIRLVPEHRERMQFDALRGLLFYGRLMPLMVASTVAVLGMLALTFASHLIVSDYLVPAIVAMLCVPLITLSDVHDGIGRGRGWMMTALLPPYVLRPLLVLLAMLGAHALGWPMSATTAAGAAIIGTWTATGLQTVMLWSRLRSEVPTGARARPHGWWLSTSLPLLAITFSEILLQNTDILVVSHNLGPDQVAIYFAAAKTMSLVLFVHYAVGSAMAGRFAALNARGDKAALGAAIRQAVNWTFWPSLAAAAGILALGKPLLWLFGPQFAAGYPVMLVLVVGFLCRAAAGPSELLLNMLGQQRAAAVVAISIASLNIALNLMLTPRFGLMGAASASATSLMLGSILNTLIARKKLGLSIAIWSNFRAHSA
ncbi:MAG: lipopolysaccharide biosynthesis protein [Hyphomicrobiaceae bacterium]